ncbi:MAG: calcium-binding protein [Alphaproteobacteria bacterium]
MPTDIRYGTSAADTIFGLDVQHDPNVTYDEIIYGMGGADTVYAGGGNDWVWGASGDASPLHFYGGAGDDVLIGFEGDDVLQGDAGNDVLIGGNGNDGLYGGDGDDQLWGGAGNDYLVGNLGSDVVDGGDGDDTLYGYGYGGLYDFPSAYEQDTLIGGNGNDIIYAQGKDAVFAGSGDDIISVIDSFGAPGIFDGGDGNDAFHIDRATTWGTFTGDAGDDIYIFDGAFIGLFGAKTVLDDQGANTVIAAAGQSNLTVMMGPGNDWIEGAYVTYAGAGDDVIKPTLGGTVYDGDGDDTIIDTRGQAVLYMGAGIDSVSLRVPVAEVVTAPAFTSFRGAAIPLGYSNTETNDYSSEIFYNSPDAIGPGNLDIVTNFNAIGFDSFSITDTYNEKGLYQVTDNGIIRDSIWYDDALGTDVYWYNDASGDLLMANSQGIFAKFIGVDAADMNQAFHYY